MSQPQSIKRISLTLRQLPFLHDFDQRLQLNIKSLALFVAAAIWAQVSPYQWSGIGRAKAIGVLVLSLLTIVVGGEFLVPCASWSRRRSAQARSRHCSPAG